MDLRNNKGNTCHGSCTFGGPCWQVLFARGSSEDTRDQFLQWWEKATSMATKNKYFGEMAWTIVGNQQNQGFLDTGGNSLLNLHWEDPQQILVKIPSFQGKIFQLWEAHFAMLHGFCWCWRSTKTLRTMQGLGPLTSLGYMPWYFKGLAPSGGNGGALASQDGFKKSTFVGIIAKPHSMNFYQSLPAGRTMTC